MQLPGGEPDSEIPALDIRNISKTFGVQRVLDEVSLDLRAGQVHALVGQNGAGKSTLIKILAGYHPPDAGGEIRLAGEPIKPGHHEPSMGFVHQNSPLIPTLNAVDNIGLSAGFRRNAVGSVRWSAQRRRARDLVGEFGVDFDVTVPVAKLRPAERTIVAMAVATEASSESLRVLVLDEVTAALPAVEVDRVFNAVRRFTAGGGAVLYVSHRLNEIFDLADRVSVLRNGRKLATCSTTQLTHGELVTMMVGQSLDEYVPRPPDPAAKHVTDMLVVQELAGEQLRGVSFRVGRGEVVGIAGITGSGREELAPLLAGAQRGRAGVIAVDGRGMTRGSPGSSRGVGIAYVPADRASSGLIMTHTVHENMLLPRVGDFAGHMTFRRRAERHDVRRWIDAVQLDPPDPQREVALLSGGNQQKVVVAKAMGQHPRVLVLDEPAQGVDVGAKHQIFEHITAAAAAGLSVVVCTAEIEDLPYLCHRVIVLNNGRITAELTGSALTEQHLLEFVTRDTTGEYPVPSTAMPEGPAT